MDSTCFTYHPNPPQTVTLLHWLLYSDSKGRLVHQVTPPKETLSDLLVLRDESECCLCAPRRLSEALCGGPKSLWDHHRESQPSFQCIRKSPSALQGTGKSVIYTIAIAIWFIFSSQNYPSQIFLMVPTVGPGVGQVSLFRPRYPKLK